MNVKNIPISNPFYIIQYKPMGFSVNPVYVVIDLTQVDDSDIREARKFATKELAAKEILNIVYEEMFDIDDARDLFTIIEHTVETIESTHVAQLL
jgi:hypothetical protein